MDSNLSKTFYSDRFILYLVRIQNDPFLNSFIGVLPSQLPKRPPVSVKIVPYEESLRLSERNFDRLLEGIFAESHQ